jgi:hypothetical protein
MGPLVPVPGPVRARAVAIVVLTCLLVPAAPPSPGWYRGVQVLADWLLAWMAVTAAGYLAGRGLTRRHEAIAPRPAWHPVRRGAR